MSIEEIRDSINSIKRMFPAKITRSLSIKRFNARSAEKRGGGEIILVQDDLADCLTGGTATCLRAGTSSRCRRPLSLGGTA